MKLSQAISERLKSLRETAGLSQQEVATKADLSLSLIAKMEQGKKADPRASTLLALASALSVPPSQLIDGLPIDPPEEHHAESVEESPKKEKKKGKGKEKSKKKKKHSAS